MNGTEGIIRAAGGVVWRSEAGAQRVLLVHRPRHDDWSFPKGKGEPGESDRATAVREVEEETGLRCRVGRPLLVRRYSVGGRPKRVAYFLMEAEDGAFRPCAEVDRIEWLEPEEARRRLSYDSDRAVLEAALEALSPEGGRTR